MRKESRFRRKYRLQREWKEREIAACQKLLKKNPRDLKAAEKIALLLFQLHRFEASLIAYDQAIKINPHQVRLYLARGRVLVELRRLGKAQDCIERALAINPQSKLAIIGKSVILRQRKKFNQAIDWCDQHLARHPDWWELHDNKSKALMDSGKLQDCIKAIDHGLKIIPGQWILMCNRAYAWLKLGKTNAAVRWLRMAIGHDKKRARYAFHNYEEFDLEIIFKAVGREGIEGRIIKKYRLRHERRERELAACREAMKKDRLNLKGAEKIALLLFQLDRLEESVVAYDRAISLNPRLIRLHLAQEAVYVEMRRYRRALDCVERALAINSKSKLAIIEKAWILRRIKLYDQAIEWCNLHLACRADLWELYANKSLAFMNSGRLLESIRAIDQGLKKFPGHWVLQYDRACALARMGMTNAALAWLQKAVDNDEELIERAFFEDDFAHLHKHPGFRKIVGPEWFIDIYGNPIDR